MINCRHIFLSFVALFFSYDVFAKSALTPEASEVLRHGLYKFAAILTVLALILIAAISLGSIARSKLSSKSWLLSEIAYGSIVILGIYAGALVSMRLM